MLTVRRLVPKLPRAYPGRVWRGRSCARNLLETLSLNDETGHIELINVVTAVHSSGQAQLKEAQKERQNDSAVTALTTTACRMQPSLA